MTDITKCIYTQSMQKYIRKFQMLICDSQGCLFLKKKEFYPFVASLKSR